MIERRAWRGRSHSLSAVSPFPVPGLASSFPDEADLELNRSRPALAYLASLYQPSASTGRAFSKGSTMKIYAGNLGYSVNDSTLRDLFAPFGTVESARVITDRDSGGSKGFGFVEMSDADAQKAMGALNGREHDGRTLRVNQAKPQESRGGYGGGGYSGGGRGRY